MCKTSTGKVLLLRHGTWKTDVGKLYTITRRCLPVAVQTSPTRWLLGANKHPYEGLVGATWLPIGIYVTPVVTKLSPNNGPRVPGVVRGHPEIGQGGG